ncbi:TetR/AcrR family transcriptional regulator [Nocardiopsis sp. NPDC006139]|uniref:TetR/AcrR family transcriptional regulator n=1 Tax=unclassified Nocardiopsis TaxID=2649073 RepID=UPI0033A1D341
MPKVSDAHRAARRDQILDAAERVIIRDGYRGASMAVIVRETGLSTGAVYGYFEGKQELFRALAERTFDLKVMSFARPQGEPPRSPGEVVRAIVRVLQRHPAMTVAPQIWAEATVDPEIRAIVEMIFGRVRGIIRAELAEWAAGEPEAVRGKDPQAWAERVTPVLLSSIPGFMLQRIVVPGFDEQAYLDALSEVFPG